MTDYTITTDFGAKDSLPSGDANKVVKGSEFTTEFTNIQTAVNTKADSAGDTFTGVVNFNASTVFNNDVIVDSDTLFVDVSTDRVGIGTNSPQAQLHVKNNDAGFEVDVDGQILDGVRLLAYDRNTSTDRNMQYSASQHLFTIGSSEKMRINTSGHVGIGTVSPDQKAHLSGAGTQYLRVENTTNSVVTDFGTSSTGSTIINRSAHPIEFFTDSTKRMTIDATGNVGIGTDSPATNLHVEGGSSGTNQALFRTSSGGGGGLQIVCSDLSLANPLWSINTFYGEELAFGDGTNEHMRIDSSGKLGIGTDSPGRALHVSTADNLPIFAESTDSLCLLGLGDDSGTVALAASGNQFAVYTGGGVGSGTGFGTEKMRIDASGNVGIGTSSPTFDSGYNGLHISQTAPSIHLTPTSSGTTASDGYAINVNSSGIVRHINKENQPIEFHTNNSERMRIDSSGNVGIGTDSPTGSYTTALHIHGSSTGASLHLTDPTSGATASDGLEVFQYGTDGYIWEREAGNLRFGTSATERMRIDSSGNVGIGVTNPTGKVQIYKGGQSSYQTYTATGSGLILQSYQSQGSPYTKTSDIVAGSDGTVPSEIRLLTRTAGQSSVDERMRIDADGNLLVGTTDTSLYNNTSGEGFSVVNNELGIAKSGACAYFNRMGSDGENVKFFKDGSTVGSIGNDTNNLVIDVSNNGNALIFEGSNTSGTTTRLAMTNAGGSEAFRPFNSDSDDLFDLGSSTRRFKDIYATNGTIQTSDRNEKQGIRELLDAEQRVATACKGLLRAFKWNSAVEAKGDEARIHFGIIAQDLQDAFTAEGLDAGDYAMFINSTETDEETGEERSRMGVRYSELLAFIISAI